MTIRDIIFFDMEYFQQPFNLNTNKPYLHWVLFTNKIIPEVFLKLNNDNNDTSY